MHKVINLLGLLGLIILAWSSPAFANEAPTIVTGTENLLDAALGWFLRLVPVACGCFIAWHALGKQLNEGDPAQAALHSRAMRNALIAGIIAESAAGIVKTVLSFYGG
jgi:hypothetical protein